MLDLVQDFLGIIGLLAASVGAGGLALVAAKQLGLDLRLSALLHATPRSPERTLELMIQCAELADREGLLRLESHVADSREPLLIRGVAMAMEGRGEREIREELDQILEHNATGGAARARLLSLAGTATQATGITLAMALLIACLALAAGMGGSLSGLVLLLGGAAGLLAIVAGSLWSDAAGMTRAADALCDLIIAEGILLLRAGRDARSIAQTLSRYLPPSEMQPQLAQAA